MLLKLLKYEFKSTWQRMVSAFAAYLILAAFLQIFVRPISGWAIVFTVIGLIVLFVVLFMTLFQRYNSNLYGSEGYLMFTLPVSGQMILLSKLIPAFVWVMGYCIVVGFSSFFMWVNYNYIPSVVEMFRAAWEYRDQIFPYVVLFIMIVLFIAISIYFSITVSKLPVWRKAGTLAGFISYCIVTFIYLNPIFNVLNDERIAEGIYAVTSSITFDVKLWIFSGYALLLCIGLFFATSYLLNHKTNLK